MSASRQKQRFRSLIAVLHNGFAVIGIVAVMTVLAQASLERWGGADRNTVFGPIRYTDDSAVERGDDAGNPKYRVLASYLARRYRVAADVTEQLVGAAYDAGREVGLDPLLILAVIAVESRFNPIAESIVGAKGLMQVDPKHHPDKLAAAGGEDVVLDPATNILLGARILKEYIQRAGSLEAGLQYYNGAPADASAQYAQKVIAEKDRLEQAMRRAMRQQLATRSAT